MNQFVRHRTDAVANQRLLSPDALANSYDGGQSEAPETWL